MRAFFCIIFILVLHPQLRAQGEQGKSAASASKAAPLNEVLETGYLLAATAKYEDAHAYLVFAAREAPTRQVYNNAGLVAILAALNYFRPNEPEVKFYYPVELDLKSAGSKGGNDFKEIRTRLLREAISHFEAAIHLDTGYAPAYLNKACAYALMGDVQKAQSEANRAKAQPGYDKTALDVQVLTGILHAQQGNSAKAKTSFSIAADQGSTLAVYNLKILQGEEIQAPASTFNLPVGIETIDSISLMDPYNLPEPDTQSEIALTSQIRLYHNLNPGPNSRFYFNDNTATGQQSYFLLTGPGYAGQTAKKLKIGAGQTEINTAYNTPVRVLETPDGQIRVYSTIILILDSDGKLASWVLYGNTE